MRHFARQQKKGPSVEGGVVGWEREARSAMDWMDEITSESILNQACAWPCDRRLS
jgi:hypothetical protein